MPMRKLFGFSDPPSEFQEPADGSQGTAGFVANMFGLGGVMEALRDPGTGEMLKAVADAVIETGRASARIEAKVDLLLEALSVDPRLISARLAAIPQRVGANGAGIAAVAGGAPDNGAGGDAAAPPPAFPSLFGPRANGKAG